MKLTYNGFALHELGDFAITQAREYESGDAPQRAKVTLKVTLDLFEESAEDGLALIGELRDALQTLHGTLKWTGELDDTVLLEQPVTLVAEELPDDPNAWGTHHQQVNLSFYFYEHDLDTQNYPLTFTRVKQVGEASDPRTLTIGNVTNWTESLVNERADAIKPERERGIGKLAASGQFQSSHKLPLDQRRAQLLVMKTDWLKDVNSKQGRLIYADFDQTVKIEEFSAEIDEAIWAIKWSFSATFVRFPAGDYATVKYQIAHREEFDGRQEMSINGSIVAPTETRARAKLATLRAALLSSTGYTASVPTREDATPQVYDGDTDGENFIDLAFALEFKRWRPDNLALTLKTSAVGATPVDFGNLDGFTERLDTRRFHELHSQRQFSGGKLTLSGTVKAALTDDLSTRRAALKTQYDAMKAATDYKDGVLKFGDTEYNVRVDNFQGLIDQPIYAIKWTLEANYTKFPNETSFALAEFNAETRDSVEDGESFLVFSGRIQANSEAAAIVKLASLRASVLAARGFSASDVLRQAKTTAEVDADTDGGTFIELSFSEEYRHRLANVLAWTLRISSREDVRSGMLLDTYSGTVTASGADATAGYQAALVKAQSLGDNKAPFKTGSTITYDQRQVTETADIEFVRLEFSYEYQSQLSGKAYIEIAQEVASQTFDVNSETVSGFVVASDFATATAIYTARVKTPFTASRLILDERTTKHQQQTQTGSTYTGQEVRLDFSLVLFKAKAANNYAIRYSQDTTRNNQTLDLKSVLAGSVLADTAANARAQLAAFLATFTSIGPLIESQDRVDVDYIPGAPATSYFLKLDFSASFQKELTGSDAILECEVSQDIDYAGIRWVQQPIPRDAVGAGGVTIMQDCGIQAGRRVVSGYATSGSLTKAVDWARKHLVMLTGSYIEPHKLKINYVFAPLVDGFFQTSGANAVNVKVHRVDFTFSEVLPNTFLL